MKEELKIREYSIQDKPKLMEILKLNVPEYFDESEIDDFGKYIDNELEKY